VRDLAKLFRTSSWPLANAKAVVASLTSSVYHKHRLFARHYTRFGVSNLTPIAGRWGSARSSVIPQHSPSPVPCRLSAPRQGWDRVSIRAAAAHATASLLQAH
jgi:hypothetical protein